MVVNTIFVS